MISQPDQVEIPDGFTDIFLYEASSELLSYLEKHNLNIKPSYIDSSSRIFVWKKKEQNTLFKIYCFQS